MDSYGWLSVLPPLLAIGLAIRTKQVYVSLGIGIWLGWTILSGWNPLAGLIATVQALVAVFSVADNTRVILFSAMIGAVITFTQASGGMMGFVNWVTGRGLVRSRKAAGFLAWFIGLVIFIESSICVLVGGAVCRPLFDRLKISREKLSYILDSTSAPKCVIIPLNAWGAFILGLLAAQGVEEPVRLFMSSIPFNFYAFFAIGLVLFFVGTEKDFGPMKKAERRVRLEGKLLRDGAEPLISNDVILIEPKAGVKPRAINMVLPVFVLVAMMPIVLLVTGNGNIMKGSGSTAVLWSVIAALLVGAVSYRLQGILRTKEITDLFMKGVGGLVPLASLMILAFAIGDTCDSLGTGPFVARVAQSAVPAAVVPALLFLVSCFIAFSTGTSWGTFAIMIPIAVPMIQLIGLHPALTVAAVLGGGVFGDHCSPISDTTIISSMASATDHIDHVRTQIPYALTAGGAAVLLYLFFGFIL
ncbi:MAG: sodium:solute symporter [Acidobacteria bacterium]|nr:sodium:solute symporter [Acidobacteriota bacterium]MBU2438697.1 sodium:solute symporter [Acidobacteriota bacterium]MBU4254463.1 sodium:solute symporter [Acidobacteriota bacterium]